MMLNKLIRRIPLNFRYSTDNFKTKLPNSLNLVNSGVKTSKMQLTTNQIEQYKRQLYEMIKQRREPKDIQELTKFLVDECEPSLHLFNIILKGQLTLRNVEGIKETLLLIAKNKFAFNSITLNLLLVYYRDLDMMDEAEKLFEAMKLRGKEASPLINCAGPNLAAYTTMIAGWTRRGDFEKAKKYYESIGKDNELKPDEHAMCAMLNAAVNTGNLEYAKNLFGTMVDPNFVSLKLWLRATFRLGDFEEAFENLTEKMDESLELSELIKWILSDLKEDYGKLSQVSLFILEAVLEKQWIRLGDPQCLHVLLDALKKDANNLFRLCQTCLAYPDRTLPIIGGRLLHHLLATTAKPQAAELATRIVEECERMGIGIPAGLLNDYYKNK